MELSHGNRSILQGLNLIGLRRAKFENKDNNGTIVKLIKKYLQKNHYMKIIK